MSNNNSILINKYKTQVIKFIPVASPPYPESIDLNSPQSINLLKEWYLIQQDASHVMLIINRSDLIITNPNDLTFEIQNYTKTKYQKNNQITYGRVLNQSDDRDILEQELRKRLTNIVKNNSILREGILKEKENSETLTAPNATVTSSSSSPSTSKQSKNYNKFKISKKILNYWFLIQYECDENCIIHSIININQFWWDLNDTKKSINQDLFIMDNDIKRKVSVLLASKKRNDIINELNLLSSVSFNLSYDTPGASKLLTTWLLVQTIKDNMEMVYTIINEAKTIRKHENLYPDIVTYIKDDQKKVLYQAVILRKSVRRNELEQELENIRANSTCMLYPLDQETLISNTFYQMNRKTYGKNLNVEYLTFSRATQTDIEYPKNGEINVDVGTEAKDKEDETLEEYENYPETELDLLRQISWMEETMYNESNILRDAFYQLDRVGSGLDREINTLEYLLSLPDML